jgi:ubiquinone/menaquinone biosynthesis C-methylase UbiE
MVEVVSVSDRLTKQKDLVRKQFAIQARAYPSTGKFRQTEKAQPIIDLARPTLRDNALDVASGWGFVALALSPLLGSVIGIDLTPEMVELAKMLAAGNAVSNAFFQVGDVENLPFASGTFDLVTCRAAFDHIDTPEKALREMKRVLGPSGRIVLYEFVAPAAPDKAAFYNRIEGARDPSHLHSMTMEEYRSLFQKCGLEERGRVVNLLKREFEAWMSYADAGDDTRQQVRSLLLDSIKGDRAGLAPRLQGGVLSFTHTCVAWLLVPTGPG